MVAKGLLSLCLLLCAAPLAWAGLYNTSEPEEEKKSDPTIDKGDWFKQVYHVTLIRLRSIGIANPPVDNPLRKRYVLQGDTGATTGRVVLSTEEKLNLSAVFIRRKKFDDAIAILLPLSRKEPKNFLVMSNLATAYQLSGLDSKAIDALGTALSIWPKQMDKVDEPFQKYLHSIGWYPSAFDFYRKTEEYQLKLLELRRRKSWASGAKRPFESVDALFPVKFVGDSGKYEAGKIAAAERDKLPKDAIDIVQQLLIWLPEDLRLYWLLGELYNAQGGPKNIESAHRIIFDELAGLGGLNVRAAELVEHRQELLNYKIPEAAGTSFADLDKAVKGVETKANDTPFRADWQQLGVGFGIGLLVAIFGSWQLREIRRRLRK